MSIGFSKVRYGLEWVGLFIYLFNFIIIIIIIIIIVIVIIIIIIIIIILVFGERPKTCQPYDQWLRHCATETGHS